MERYLDICPLEASELVRRLERDHEEANEFPTNGFSEIKENSRGEKRKPDVG